MTSVVDKKNKKTTTTLKLFND